MGSLKNNTKLMDYLNQNYSTTHYRFHGLLGNTFPYKKLDLNSITELKIDGLDDLSGIEELPNLKSVTIKGAHDLSCLEKCPNLTSIEAELPEDGVNIDSLINLSSKPSLENCFLYGRGVHSISSEQALSFDGKAKLSYEEISKFTPEEFSHIQARFEEVHSMITPEMSEVEKVKTIYKGLLKDSFEYDYNVNSKGANGYLINSTMYGPLVENKGVCSGISSALEHALRNEGLDAVSCGGWANNKPSAGDSHQWNQVKIGDDWYNLDLTNDYDKKSWRFFLKSDEDMDWKECHYIDKTDKFERFHDCTSTKYDEVFREDPIERQLRELREQKRQATLQKINSPLSSDYDEEFIPLRDKANKIFESTHKDEYLNSNFNVYRNDQNEERCTYQIVSSKKDSEPSVLISEDFKYSDKFRTGMIEPSVVDFSKRCPVISSKVTSSSDPSHVIENTPTSNAVPTQNNTEENNLCNVNLIAENNSSMTINNVEQTFAQQVEKQAPQIEPNVFMDMQPQTIENNMAGATLSMTSSGMGGFINHLPLISLGIIVIGIIIWILILIIK